MRLLLVLPLLYVPGFAQTSAPLPAQQRPFYSDPLPPVQILTCGLPQIRRSPLAPFDFCTPEQTKKTPSTAPGVGTPEKAAVSAPAKPPAQPRVCSIPLLRVPAVETHDDRMVVSVPLVESKDVVVVAPAPACDDKK
jgi:hypothetical protein